MSRKYILKERLKHTEKWMEKFLDVEKNKNISKKALRQLNKDKPILGLIFFIIYLPSKIYDFIDTIIWWNQYRKASKEVEEAGLLKKGKKLEKGVVGVLDELNAPSKKEQRRVSEEQRYLQGEMSDAEARAYIQKQGGRKAKGKSKKAAKQVEGRKKKKKKAKEKEWRKDPKYKKGAGKKGGYDF